MYKKTLINLTAITMAMSLAFAPAVTTFAADTDVAIEHFLPEAREGVEVNENGDVGTVIEVGENENVVVEEGDVVTIKGNPVGTEEDSSALEAGKDSIVFVEGESITSETVGVDAKSGSVVIVGGDKEYEKNDNITGTEVGIKSEDGAVVAVKGNVTGNYAVVNDGTGLIFIDGDLKGDAAGVLIESAPGKSGGVVIVTGEIGAETPMSDTRKIILLNGADHYTDYSEAGKNEDGSYDYAKIAQAIIDSFPEFYAYQYNGISIKQNYSIDESGLSYDTLYHEYLATAYNSKTNYIIKTDDSTKDLYEITGGYDQAMYDNYGLMTLSAKSALTVAAKEGYTITGGESVTVTDNGDNTYTVKIKSWHGDINIRAVLKPVAATVAVNENNEYYVTSNPEQGEETVEVPFIFASFSIIENGDLPEVLGASLEDGVVTSRPVVKVKAGELTAIQYKRAFIDTVKNAPANAVVKLETSASSCIDKMMMEALAARPDVTLEVTFPINHNETVTATVPAGYDVMSLLDENGYCGFLYLNSVFNK